MPFSFFGRRPKRSRSKERNQQPDPEGSTNDHQTSLSSSSSSQPQPLRKRNQSTNSKTTFSIFSRPSNNNNNNNNNNNSSSLLPMTHNPSSSPSPLKQQRPTNNFLLGGNYYPQKNDPHYQRRRRRHKHHDSYSPFRNTLWYRILWSSPIRKGLTCILLLYTLGRLGRWWWKSHGNDTHYDGSLDSLLPVTDRTNGQSYPLLPSLEHELQMETNVQQALDDPQSDYQTKRNHIFEKIAPHWYHRNDPNWIQQQEPEQEEPSSDSTNEKEEEEAHKDVKMDDPQETNDHLRDNTPEDDDDGMVQTPQLRTLQSMSSFANQSHCPSAPISDIGISLVVQTSMDRVWILEETCRRWQDPIVAVIGLTDTDETATKAQVLHAWKDKCPQLTLIDYKLTESVSQPDLYPINHLRNAALDMVETSHVLLVDVDFVPSQDLSSTIRSILQTRQYQRDNVSWGKDRVPSTDRDAIVVPAFERVLHPPCTTEQDCKQHLRRNSSFIPHSFDELQTCVQQKDCIVFQSDVNWEGHYSTRSKDWLEKDWYGTIPGGGGGAGNETDVKPIKTIPCFHSLRYEPYVVLPWCPMSMSKDGGPVSPYYDERFHGYGKNKISYIQHLRILGFQFSVLPQGFMVHNPHVESQVKQQWNDPASSNLHSEMDQLYPKFLQELRTLYGNATRHYPIVQGCPETQG